MKEKACKASEIITTIWVTENAKQRSTIPFCVVCYVCIFLFCFILFVDVPKHVNTPWRVLYREKNHSESCTGRTKHRLCSGHWHALSRREGFLSLCLPHPAHTHPRVAVITGCQDSDTHLPFL